MKKLVLAAALCAGAMLAQPATVAAQDGPAGEVAGVHPAYVTVYDTVMGSVDLRAQAGSIALQVIDQMISTSPILAEAVAETPQVRLDLAKAMRPFLMESSLRMQALYRPRFIAAMADVLSVEEAQLVTQLLTLPAGRRLVSGAVSNIELDETLEEASAGAAFSREAISAEQRRASERTLAEMSAADTAELDRFAASNPGVVTAFRRLAPRMLDLRVQMENEPLLPEEEAAMDSAISAVLAEHGMVLNPE